MLSTWGMWVEVEDVTPGNQGPAPGRSFIELSGYLLSKTRNNPCSRSDDVPGFTFKLFR